jgi:hypothetical protein
MVQLGSDGINQVDWEKLDIKEIVIRSAHPAQKVIVLQPYAGVGFTIVFDDVARCSETPQEIGVAHGTSKRLRARPFRTELCHHGHHGPHDAGFTHVAGTVCHRPLGDVVSIPEVLIKHPDGLSGRGLKILSTMKSFLHLEPLGWPFVPRPWDVWVAK